MLYDENLVNRLSPIELIKSYQAILNLKLKYDDDLEPEWKYLLLLRVALDKTALNRSELEHKQILDTEYSIQFENLKRNNVGLLKRLEILRSNNMDTEKWRVLQNTKRN